MHLYPKQAQLQVGLLSSSVHAHHIEKLLPQCEVDTPQRPYILTAPSKNSVETCFGHLIVHLV